jgi:spoIIIJ-associated protein
MVGNEQEQLIDSAREILEKLLELMGIEATVTSSTDFPVEGDDGMLEFASLNIEGEDLGILIGRKGQTLSSLQYMVRLILCQQTQEKIPIIIDIEGYKRRRYNALRALAERIAEQVKLWKRPFTLEPMPAFERRIIHLTLANYPGITTESTGTGENRKVVIMARKG